MKKLSTMILATLFTFGMAYAQEEKFEIDGAIQISDSEDPSPDAGTIRYNTSTNTFEGYDGSSWLSLVTDADADPSNEIQILSISGDTLNLSGGGMVILPEVGRLHILDSLKNTITLQSSGYNNTGIAFQRTDNDYLWNIYKEDGPGGSLIFAGGNGDSDIDNLTPRLTIREDGNVGIGTTNPTAALNVNGDSKLDGKLETFGANTILNQGGDAVDFRVESQGALYMLHVDGTTNRVGINKNNPEAGLDVNETSIFRDDFTFNPQQDTSDFRIASQGISNLFFADGTNNRIGIGTPSPTTGLDIRLQTAIKNNVFINPTQNNYDFNVSSKDSFNIFHVDAQNNRIGIGTNAPTNALDIRLTTVFKNSTIFNPSQLDKLFRISTVNKLNTFYVDAASDRIGIGTGSPGATLDVNGSFISRGGGVTFNEDAEAVKFRVESAGNTHMLYVDGANNRVGIGTNSPGVDFHVAGETRFALGDVTVNESSGPYDFRVEAQGVPYMFYVNATTKRIGINTNNPSQMLHVNGGSFINGQLELNSNAGQQPLLIRGHGGVGLVGITQNSVGGTYSMELTTADGSGNQATRMLCAGNSDYTDIKFYTGAQGNETETMKIEGTTGEITMTRDSIDDDWGLYIKNKQATNNLGGIRMNNGGFLELTVNADNSSPTRARLNSAGTWSVASDRRLKSHIDKAENLLEKALKLNPVNYHFISDKSQNLQLGFIAQDVQKIFPEMVEEGDIYTLNYAGLSVVAIGAIKELHHANELLEDRVRVLEAQLQTMAEIKEELKKEIIKELQNKIK